MATTTVLFVLLLLPRHAPGTVAEQRARLPPPATCVDPVEGVWQSHARYPDRGVWRIFTLEVHRVEGSDDQLYGAITNLGWDGGVDDDQPGGCQGQSHWLVAMAARGQLDGREVHFGGTSWRLVDVYCGPQPPFAAYNLDQFSGTIDDERQEFQSVNNDGGVMVNMATVFRRIRCFDAPPPPRVAVTPPAFYPNAIHDEPRSSGCGAAP